MGGKEESLVSTKVHTERLNRECICILLSSRTGKHHMNLSGDRSREKGKYGFSKNMVRV